MQFENFVMVEKETDLSKIKEKYENVNELAELTRKLDILTQTISSSFEKLNRNLDTLVRTFTKLNEMQIQKSAEKVSRTTENLSKRYNNLARVITTTTGTYVRLYKTIDSYYIIYKTIFNQLKKFNGSLEATISYLKDFNVVTYLIDGLRLKMMKVEAGFMLISSILSITADVLEGFAMTNKKTTGLLKELFKDFIFGTDEATKKINIFGYELEYSFTGLKNIFNKFMRAVDKANNAFFKLISIITLEVLTTFTNLTKTLIDFVLSPRKSFRLLVSSVSSTNKALLLKKKAIFDSIKALSKFTLSLLVNTAKIAFAFAITHPIITIIVLFGFVLKKVIEVIKNFNISGIQTFLVEAAALLKNFVYDLIVYILKVFKTIKMDETLRSFFKSLFDLLKAVLAITWPILKPIIWLLAVSLKGLAMSLTFVIKVITLFANMLRIVTDIVLFNTKDLKDALNYIKNIIKGVWDVVGPFITKLLSFIAQPIIQLTHAITNVSTTITKIQTPFTILSEVLKGLVEVVKDVVEMLRSIFSLNPLKLTNNFIKDMIEGIGNVFDIKLHKPENMFYKNENESGIKPKNFNNENVGIGLRSYKNENVSIENKSINPVFNISIYANDKAMHDEIVKTFRILSKTIFGI